MTVDELDFKFDKVLFDENNMPIAKGWTVGRGKTMFWYITHQTQSGYFRCYPTDEKGNTLPPRYLKPETEVTIHYL